MFPRRGRPTALPPAPRGAPRRAPAPSRCGLMIMLCLDIVATAAILFIVAAGLLIVFGVMKVINFAHGAFLTVGGYSGVIAAKFGLGLWWSIPVALVIGFALGAVIERMVVRTLYA